MKQALFSRPGRVDIRHVPEPQRAPGDVLVAVGACGICTWEQRVFRGVRAEYPLLGGHEVGATVREVPEGTGLRPGDVVAVSLLPRCGDCRYCRMGRSNLCSSAATGARPDSQPWGPKGLSELLVVPSSDVFPLGPAATCEEAAIVEPVACVLHSLDRSRCRPGDLLAVFGLGFTGALHLACARARGLRTVGIATARDNPPYGLCTADVIVGSSDREDIRRTLHDLPGGERVDAAVITRGGGVALRTAVDLVGFGGHVVLFQSIPRQESLDLDLARLRSGEITVTGSVSHHRTDFAAAASLIGTDAVRVRPLIGQTFGLDDVQEAVAHAVAHPGRRTMVVPGHG